MSCNKKFAKSSLNSHVKSKHFGRSPKVKCCLCDKVFDKASKAVDHVALAHKVYHCTNCSSNFSEFDKLKAHLKTQHNCEWPWICGFCDLVLLYDLEFQVHIKQHTEKPPFACPICSRLFSDNNRCREHLARQHLPDSTENFEPIMSDNKKVSQAKPEKDEAAVSRELAALLLNLSDGGARNKVDIAEDLSLKSTVETAIDLTKSKPEITLTPTMPASITKLVKGSTTQATTSSSSGVTVTKTSVKTPSGYPSATTGSSQYPFYPSLAASMTSLSPTLAMNSNYLLHNLLLGKFQQIANSSTGSNTKPTDSYSSATPANTTAMATALPTHPLPAQTLSLPASKPPASVLKSASPNSSAAAAVAGYNLQLLSEASSSSTPNGQNSNSSIDIPYMCRQIVTLLNGLLFHQHNLNNPSVEMNVHTQLGAIYTRLQEVVVMVEQAKKIQQETKAKAQEQQEKHLKDSKAKEEEKIAKHIHEYQRALLKQHENNQAAVAAAAAAAISATVKETDQQVDVVDSIDESAEMVKNRRRGRPPKNSNMDLSYSPPEKKFKGQDGQIQNQAVESSNPGEGQNPIVASAINAVANHLNGVTGGSKGGKGIRNRVFCGECTGCLKNDDCGKCRYCKDKTKFGGQNRLRQKCLHRRCQLDTHRRRSSQNQANQASQNSVVANNTNNGHGSSFTETVPSRQSPSPDAIYSGVALARLASRTEANLNQEQDKQLSPGEIIRTSGQPVFPQGDYFFFLGAKCATLYFDTNL